MPRKGFKMPSAETIAKGGKPGGAYLPAKPKQKKRGSAAAKAQNLPLCGAKKRGGGRCTLRAGWGTIHPGSGSCKLHGGSVPNHIKAAASDEYRKLLGVAIEINPFDALLWCIRLRAGEIKWLTERMASLTKEEEWTEETLVGKQFHLFARERQHAMSDLARYSQMAISLGIAERSVRLAEAYGQTLGRLIKGILEELGLTEEQKRAAPGIVRKWLIQISAGVPEESALATETRKEIPKKAAA